MMDLVIKKNYRGEMKMKIYQKLANLQIARSNCIKSGNKEWEKKHTEKIEHIMYNFSPSGSGLDNGTKFDYEKSDEYKLIFYTSYHVLNGGGYYTNWINFSVTVISSLCFEIDIRIKGSFGKDQDVKDIVYDRFYDFLLSEIA